MEKPIQELTRDDSVYLYHWENGEVVEEIEYKVKYIEIMNNKSIGLDLVDGKGNKKIYSFLHPDTTVTVRPKTDNPILFDTAKEELSLEEENAKLRKALEFYAAEEKYEYELTYDMAEIDGAAILNDSGRTARTALNTQEDSK